MNSFGYIIKTVLTKMSMTTFCTSTRTELVEALLLSSAGSSPASVSSSDDDCSEVEMLLDFDEDEELNPLPTDLHLITAGDSEAMSSAVFCFVKNFVW